MRSGNRKFPTFFALTTSLTKPAKKVPFFKLNHLLPVITPHTHWGRYGTHLFYLLFELFIAEWHVLSWEFILTHWVAALSPWRIKSSGVRESTFIIPRGDEDVKGGTEIFSGIKGEALNVLDILKGGSKLFKILVQQGPGVFTPTIVNRIDGLETPPYCEMQLKNHVKFKLKFWHIQVKFA
jgi:hypothetical protein